MDEQKQTHECCPPFDPTPWDDKTCEWDNKRFIKDKVCTLFKIPMNFGTVITRMNNKVEAAGAQMPDWLCLSDQTSNWNMDLYLAVDKEVPGAQNVTLSGTYMTKVYEGDYRHIGAWCKDFEAYVKGQGKQLKKLYMWYTTCPGCAKKWGKNYIVFFGRVL